MRWLILSAAVAMGLMLAPGVRAQAPHQVTATCKDGTTFAGTSRRGACGKHGGVATWTTAATAPAAPVAAPPRTPTAPSGGHAGQVWVNKSSKVYHCRGDKWFGKAKNGEYLTETAAKAAGYRPAYGKACTS